MGQGGFGSKPSGSKGGQGAKPSGYTSGTKGYQPGGSFWDFNPRPVAGVNPYTAGAAEGIKGIPGAGSKYFNQTQQLLKQLAGAGSGYMNDAISAAKSGVGTPTQFGVANQLGNKLLAAAKAPVTGETLSKDPAILAAQERFKKARMPLINNMAAQAGLGRSNTAVNAAALAQSNELLPLMQAGLDREMQTKNQILGALGQNINTAMGQGNAMLGSGQQDLSRLVSTLGSAAGQQASNIGNAAQGMSGLGQQEASQYLAGVNAAGAMGDKLRGIEQEQLNAPYQEQQRLWAEALNSMYGPLGFLGNMGGATSTTSKK